MVVLGSVTLPAIAGRPDDAHDVDGAMGIERDPLIGRTEASGPEAC